MQRIKIFVIMKLSPLWNLLFYNLTSDLHNDWGWKGLWRLSSPTLLQVCLCSRPPNVSQGPGTSEGKSYQERPRYSMTSLLCHQILCPIQQGAHTFQSSFYCWCTCRNPYHCSSQTLPDSVGFSLLNLIPTCSDSVSIFLLPPHLGYFLMFEFASIELKKHLLQGCLTIHHQGSSGTKAHPFGQGQLTELVRSCYSLAVTAPHGNPS